MNYYPGKINKRYLRNEQKRKYDIDICEDIQVQFLIQFSDDISLLAPYQDPQSDNGLA